MSLIERLKEGKPYPLVKTKYVIYDIEQNAFVSSGRTRVDVTKASSYSKIKNAIEEGIGKAIRTGNPSKLNYEIISVEYKLVGLLPQEKWCLDYDEQRKTVH